jgi:hypothetical protein
MSFSFSSSVSANNVSADTNSMLEVHKYHPLAQLLEMSAPDILESYRMSQLRDFTATLRKAAAGTGQITDQIKILQQYLQSHSADDFRLKMGFDTVEKLFLRAHDHVMSHPVWLHPFFVRIVEGPVTLEQLTVFAKHYFNQVKNTRQCVALALGRFHTMMKGPDDKLNCVLAELTQVVLAGLLADEFGTAEISRHDQTETGRNSAVALDIGRIFSPTTHPGLFRRFLEAIGVVAQEYDVPMLHGVADNVLVQRILSQSSTYNELEALASVGLGMEWGVPAFFSMIISGLLKAAQREGLSLDPAAMEIWSAHVHQDVEHAIAVMIVTAFFVGNEADIRRIEGATNVLMAFRYNMMSDIYYEVFGSKCPLIKDVDLDPAYFLPDRRMEKLLIEARSQVASAAVRDVSAYVDDRRGLDEMVPVAA